MKKCLHFWVLLHLTAAVSNGAVLYVSPSPAGSPCPAEPCHTLSEYAHNIDEYVSDNTKFVFLPGTHYLDTDFRVSNISSLVLLGDNSSLPELSSRVVCNNTASMVVITGVSQLFISTLEVTSCGETVSLSVKEVDSFDVILFHLFDSATLHIYNSTALLEDTNFTNNTGTGCGGSVRIEYSNVTLNGTNSFAYSHTSESGGGMCVIGSSFTANGIVTFYGNTATQDGGGFFATLCSSCSMNFLSNSIFDCNHAYGSGGGMAAYGNVTLKGTTLFSMNWCNSSGSALYSFDSVTFVGVVVFENNSLVSSGTNWTDFKTYVIYIKNTLQSGVNTSIALTGNGYNFRSCDCIIYIENIYIISGHVEVIDNCGSFCIEKGGEMKGKFVFRNNGATALDFFISKISLQGNFLFHSNLEDGALYALQSTVTILPNTTLEFIGNRNRYIGGGALGLMHTTFILSQNTTIRFVENSAGYSGGALKLLNSTIYLSSNSSVYFTGNSAEEHGGAIFVQDTVPIAYCLPLQLISQYTCHCFLQVPQDYYDIDLVFNNNSALVGSDIYGGIIDLCKLVPQNLTDLSGLLNNLTGNYSTLEISSPPYQLCYCIENTTECIKSTVLLTTIFPGETIKVSVFSRGQRNQPSPAKITAQQAFSSRGSSILPNTDAKTSTSCSNIEYKVTSTDLSGSTYRLSVNNCGGQTRNSVYIKIAFKDCLPFFELDSDSGVCRCVARIQNYTKDCKVDDQSIAREGSTWIGYDNASESYIIHQYCPLDYCKPTRVFMNYTQVDRQCTKNRRGLLCGECLEKHSLMLGSFHCGKCSQYNLFLLIFFVFAGVALVVLLLVLRLTVAEGTINGLIFYANVFYSNGNYFIGPRNGFVVLDLFLAWLNLDFGFESCFYDGMDMYQNTWLQFLFPLYIWVLIVIVIVSSRFSSWVTRKLGTNPVAVLATLVLLSYNKILHTVVFILSSTHLLYIKPNSSEYKDTVWLYDANITFFEGKHIPICLVALLLFIFFLLPYTLLLVFGQFIQAKSNLKIFSWVNKPMFKYFLDNYHAPYQNRHRYWTGLMLLVRIVILIVFVSDVSNDPLQYLLAIITVVIFVGSRGWTLGTLGIYKNHWIDLLNVSFVLNLVILSTVILFCESEQVQKENQIIIGYVSLGVAFVTFLGIIIYHVYLQARSTKIVSLLVRKCLVFCKRKQEEEGTLLEFSSTCSIGYRE